MVDNIWTGKPSISFHIPESSKQSSMGQYFCTEGGDLESTPTISKKTNGYIKRKPEFAINDTTDMITVVYCAAKRTLI